MNTPRTPSRWTRQFAVAFIVVMLAALVLHDRIALHAYDSLEKQVLHGNVMALKVAVMLGLDVNAPRDGEFVAPLFAAIESRKAESVSYLLAHGANPDLEERFGLTPLELAARNGDLKIVELLVDAGADVSKRGENGTAIDAAENGHHAGVVKFLAAHGAVLTPPP